MVVDIEAVGLAAEDTWKWWTLWGNMRIEWRSYKRKGDSHQRSHHVKYVYDERKDHSNDNPYVQDCTQKHTLSWLSSQLCPLTRGKQDITCASKNPKMVIARWNTKQHLTRTFSRQFGWWLSIYEIYCSGNSITPKVIRKKGGNQKGSSSLNEMAMLALSNTILSVSTRTRKLRKSTLWGQKLAKSTR